MTAQVLQRSGLATIDITLSDVEPYSDGSYEHPSLSSVLAEVTVPGDEVIYIGRWLDYVDIIQSSGVVPIRVRFDTAPCNELATFVRALTPRTRAVILGSDSAGRSLPRDVIAALMRLLATAKNIFGRPLYLVSVEGKGTSPLGVEVSASLASLYPYMVISSEEPVAA